MEMLKISRGVFGLFNVYGEAKTTVSVAEIVGRLLQIISRIAGSSIVICIYWSSVMDRVQVCLHEWTFEVLKMALSR